MPVVSPAPCRCLGADWRPAQLRQQAAVRCPALPARQTSFPGEDAPGTGLRHFPEQAVDSSEGSQTGGFEMRSTAEVYELFDALQRQRGEAVGDDAPREAAAGSLPAGFDLPLTGGPFSGRRRRPGLVNSMEGEEEEGAQQRQHFQMLSTAEVNEMWENQNRLQQWSAPKQEGDNAQERT